MVSLPDNEVRLIERARGGDFESFSALYSCYLDAIYRYIYYRTGNAQDAEDITEGVFLKAWEALPHYKQMGCSFIQWLYRIAHNNIVDYHRHLKVADHEPLEPDAILVDMEQKDALDGVISSEEAASLAGAIATLPEEYQQFITLRFIEGMSHAEIALITGKSEVACRGMQHRALTSLNRMLSVMKEGN